MKFRLLAAFMGALLLTGCGQEAENIPSTQDAPSATHESTTTETTMQESDSVQDSSTEESSAEEEVFVLTFEAETTEGEIVTSDIFSQSKLTMLNVWATYCNPCLSEMPDLGEIAGEYDPEIFQMYGIISDVTTEDSTDKIEEARTLISETGADYPHLLLNQSLYSNLVGGISGVPTTFFFNQDSELLGYLVGAQSKETWIAVIEDLLSQME